MHHLPCPTFILKLIGTFTFFTPSAQPYTDSHRHIAPTQSCRNISPNVLLAVRLGPTSLKLLDLREMLESEPTWRSLAPCKTR